MSIWLPSPKPSLGYYADSPGNAEYPNLLEGLVGAWSPVVSGPTGDKLFDLSPYGNDGTRNGSVSWVTRRHGTAISFTDVGQYFAIPDKPWISLTGKATMLAWIETTQDNTFAADRIVDKGSDSPNLYYNTNETIGFGDINGFMQSGVDVSDGIAHCVAGMHDGGNNNAALSVWVDGNNASTSAAGTFNGWTDQSTDLHIGNSSPQDNTKQFYGQIYEVLLWNRTLTANEFAQLFELGPGGWATPRRRLFPAGAAAAPAAAAPTSHIYGPLVGPLGGPV